ncbi:MAG: hypothetical protein WC683_03765 [bacterium]
MAGGEVQRAAPDATAGSCAPDVYAGETVEQQSVQPDAAAPESFDSAGQPVSEMPPEDGFELVDPERETRQIDSPRRDWKGLDKTLFKNKWFSSLSDQDKEYVKTRVENRLSQPGYGTDVDEKSYRRALAAERMALEATDANRWSSGDSSAQLTMEDYLKERTKLLDKESGKALSTLMDANLDPAEAVANGKRGVAIYERGYLDAVYQTSVEQAVEVEMHAAGFLGEKVTRQALPDIVKYGLAEVKGDAARLPEFMREAMSEESLRRLAIAAERALSDKLSAKLKDAAKMTAKGGVTWGIAEAAVGAMGVENPTARFAGVIYLMHGQGVAIETVIRARAAAKAGGTKIGTELYKEISKLAPGATAAEKAASLGKSVVKAPIEAIKGLGSGLLASKIAGLAAKAAGADDTTAGLVSTAAFFSPQPLARIFGNTRAAALVSRTPLPKVARAAGNTMVAGLADELIYNGVVTVAAGDDSDYALAVSMENTQMMGQDFWTSVENIPNLPWYEIPFAASAAVPVGALMLVSDLLVPGFTAGVMKKVCDWSDTGFTRDIERRYMAEGKQKSKAMGEDLKRLVVHGMGDENENPEFYQEVNLHYLGGMVHPMKDELVREKEEMSFDFEFDEKNEKRLRAMGEGEMQLEIDAHVMSKMGEDRFRQAASVESAARMQEELKFLHMIGYDGGEGASAREIVDEHGRVLDADALLTTYVTPQLVEDEGKDPAFKEMADKAKAELDENKVMEAEAKKAAVASDYEEGGDSYYYNANEAKPLILAARKRELVIRALQTPAGKKKDELMKLAANVGLCDESGEFVRTSVYYSAVEMFVEDAYARNVDALKDVANARYKEIKTRSYNADSEKESLEIEKEMDVMVKAMERGVEIARESMKKTAQK